MWLGGTETWGVFYRHDPFGCSPIPGLDWWLTSLLAGLYCGFNKFSVALISRPSRRSNSSSRGIQKNCGWTKPDLLRPPAYLQAITLRAMPSQHNSSWPYVYLYTRLEPWPPTQFVNAIPAESSVLCMFTSRGSTIGSLYGPRLLKYVEWRCDDWI